MTEPLVSVVILNHNRKEILRECLESALDLDWPNLEWILVDNASTDGSAEMAEEEFGEHVRVIRRSENCVTAARNQGFEAARGKVILSLDNDIILPDRKVVGKGMELFERFPQAGLLSFVIGDPDSPARFLPEHWWHPVPHKEGQDRFFLTTYFPEAALFLRAEAFRVTGGYDPLFHMGVEQIDLALKLLREGYQVLYCPNLVCVERVTRGQLASQRTRIHYLNMRNKLWIAWKHYPLGKGFRYAMGRIGASAIRSLRHGWFGYFLEGLRDGVLAPKGIRDQRKPLPASVWKTHDRIQRGWFVEGATASPLPPEPQEADGDE